MKEITAYACDYCYNKEFNRDWMESHEKRCKYNPENKRCHTCKHVIPEDCNSEHGMPKVNASRNCNLKIRQKFNYSWRDEPVCLKYEQKDDN